MQPKWRYLTLFCKPQNNCYLKPKLKKWNTNWNRKKNRNSFWNRLEFWKEWMCASSSSREDKVAFEDFRQKSANNVREILLDFCFRSFSYRPDRIMWRNFQMMTSFLRAQINKNNSYLSRKKAWKKWFAVMLDSLFSKRLPTTNCSRQRLSTAFNKLK